VPHFPKPFFRNSRKLWYVQLDGTQHNLGPDQGAAFAAYHELMRKPREQRKPHVDSVAVWEERFRPTMSMRSSVGRRVRMHTRRHGPWSGSRRNESAA